MGKDRQLALRVPLKKHGSEKLTTSSITKLCVVGVLLTVSVLPSQAVEPEDITVHSHVSDAIAAPFEALENYGIVSLNRVHFSAGHSNPSHREKATLDQIANLALERSATIIELRGYADGASSPAANFALSVERANTIARFLIERRVPRERILILGLGEVDPTGPRRAEHQRVDVRVFAPPSAETSVRHESVVASFIQDTWGGK
jgi:outer membrane protein OmpA-like peptidoglycan-associated protein